MAEQLSTRFDPKAISRFKKEFRALQDLRHPNLLQHRELLFVDNEWVLTSELVDGVDLLDYITGGELSAESAPPAEASPAAQEEAKSEAGAPAQEQAAPA